MTGNKIITAKSHNDARGRLVVGEFLKDIPFLPKRYFAIRDVPEDNNIRGQHAHYECEQFLICLNGVVKVDLDDGKSIDSFLLDSPEKGIYIPRKIWGVQQFQTPDTVLLVFASHYYEESDYIRDYNFFKKIIGD